MENLLKKSVISEIAERWNVPPEYLWEKTPDICVFRHVKNRKWFAIIMYVPYRKIGIDKAGNANIINIKCGEMMTGSLLKMAGFRPAWHMNKKNWITILLDGTVPLNDIMDNVALSYALTES